MKLNKLTLLCISLVTMSGMISCDEKDGYAVSPEFPREKVVSSDENTIVLKAKNDVPWEITQMTINDESISRDRWNTYPGLTFHQNKQEDNAVDYPYLQGIYQVDYTWFTWKKLDNQTIEIDLNENDAEKERIFSFNIWAGNAFQQINIVQK